LYPFGFAALFLQFTRYFGLEFYTAWYAASLVNRMVVIGLGTSILLVTLLGSVLLAGNVGQGLLRKDEAGLSASRRRSVRVARLVIAPLTGFVLYVLYSRILAAGRVYGKAIVGTQSAECREQALRHQLNLWPDSLMPASILIGGAILGGWLISRSYRRYREEQSLSAADHRLRSIFSFFYKGITQGWMWPGLTVAYVFGVLASLWLAWATPAFLPFMTYGTATYSAEQERNLQDRFLSYTDGRWYFLHRVKPDTGEPGYRVVALADSAEKAKYVRVRPHPAQYPRVAPALCHGRRMPLPRTSSRVLLIV
jgi:hypothetical protein